MDFQIVIARNAAADRRVSTASHTADRKRTIPHSEPKPSLCGDFSNLEQFLLFKHKFHESTIQADYETRKRPN